MTLLDCDRALHAWIPSYHVCRCFVLPSPSQFLNQEPPRPQQLFLPDFSMVPHLGQTDWTVVNVATAGIYIHEHWPKKQREKGKTLNSQCFCHAITWELTFAGLHAFRPPVINIAGAKLSAVLEPSTARSATADSARFPECSTPWARQRVSDR